MFECLNANYAISFLCVSFDFPNHILQNPFCRKIRSCVRLYSNTNICCIVLPFLCLCRYVWTKWIVDERWSQHYRSYSSVQTSIFYSFLCRCCWFKFPSILQPQQLPHKVHTWILSFYGLLYSSVLQWVHCNKRFWPCPYVWKMGKPKFTLSCDSLMWHQFCMEL